MSRLPSSFRGPPLGSGVIGRAREGVAEPPSLVEALRHAGVDSFAGEAANLPALEIGERIREARQAAGLTQTQLAKISGCNQSDLSDIERGRGRDGPSYKTLRSIATALGVELPVNPQPATPSIAMVVGDEAQVNFAETAYDQLYPLYAEFEWAHVGGRVKTQLEKVWAAMSGDAIIDEATTCQIVNVGPSQQARFRCDRGFSVIGRVRGGGDVRVSKAVYRFQSSEPGEAVAILGGESELVVNTAAGESCVFMAVPAHLLLGHGG